MKKILYILMAAAVVFAACAKEIDSPEEENIVTNPTEEVTDGNTISFTCQYPTLATDGEGSKTTINGEGYVSWEAGDEITIYYLHEGTPQVDSAITSQTGTSATFIAELPDGHHPDHFWAAYPAGKGTLTNEGGNEQFSLTLGKTDGSFKAANLMAAYTTADAKSFAFKNAVGIVRIALPEGGVISHDGDHTISTIRIKGKETSIASQGSAMVNVTEGAVSGYDYSNTGTKAMAVDLTDDVRASGYAYIPSYPGELTHGFAVRYYSESARIPAVLTKDTPVTITAGHIKPLSDLTERIVWGYYVSAAGTGDGHSDADPMSIAAMESLLTHGGAASVIMCYSNQLNGTTFHFKAGTHSIASPIVLPAQTVYSEPTYYTITGDNEATLDGGGSSRIFNVTNANDRFTVKDITLTNGAASLSGGLVLIQNSAPTFEHCTFSNTSSSQPGGAVRVDTKGKGKGEFNNCTFTGNTGQYGGAFVITDSTSAKFTVCNFTGNSSTKSGGAVYSAIGTTIFSDCTFTDNIAAEYGGAVHVADGDLTFDNCTIGADGHGNSAANGGALNAFNGTVKINCGSISYNTASSNAGGIHTPGGNYAPTYYINRCSFVDNTATLNGYAIYLNTSTAPYAAKLCVNNSYFYNSSTLNTSGKNQSIVCNKGETILMNSTIVGTLGSSAWGSFALGAHKNFSDPNGCLLINCIIKNKASAYQYSTYETGGNYYAVIKSCLTRVNYKSMNDDQKSQIVEENVATDDDITFTGYTWNGAVPDGFVKKTEQEIQGELLKIADSNTTPPTPTYALAANFLNWLEGITYDVSGETYNALQVDINGTHRSGAYWPGCYQD